MEAIGSSRTTARRRALAALGLPLALAACAQVGPTDDATRDEEGLVCDPLPVDPAKSLFVTDSTVLAAFPLKKVMSQIAQGSTSGQTGLGIYQQMLDTLNSKAGGFTSGPHCDDVIVNGKPSINGFPIECPRQEGVLAGTNPFGSDGDSYHAIGVVNRFDLAPKSGANCGQYRVVYGKNSGGGGGLDRALLIFEATLPNPQVTVSNPNPGLVGCGPVAKFWSNLTAVNDPTVLASRLQHFYFTGLAGFEPVVKAEHYGIGGGPNTGQIRGNLFMAQRGGQQWELREFRLSRICLPDGSGCALTAHNTAVQNNPFGGLFGGTDDASAAFQKQFLKQVKPLAAGDVNLISMSTPFIDDAGESDEQDQSNDYDLQSRSNSAFRSAIAAKLASINSDLTVDNLLDRATTQACAGCHQLSNSKNLGDQVVWPPSRQFVQVDEQSNLSTALTSFFLPFRASILEKFVASLCSSGAVPGDDGLSLAGGQIGAAN